MSARVTSKTIRVMGPDFDKTEDPGVYDERNQEVVNDINWSAVEDILNDQLPEGYYAKVED